MTVTDLFPTDKSVDIEFKITYNAKLKRFDRVADLFKSWSFIDVLNIVDNQERNNSSLSLLHTLQSLLNSMVICSEFDNYCNCVA